MSGAGEMDDDRVREIVRREMIDAELWKLNPRLHDMAGERIRLEMEQAARVGRDD